MDTEPEAPPEPEHPEAGAPAPEKAGAPAPEKAGAPAPGKAAPPESVKAGAPAPQLAKVEAPAAEPAKAEIPAPAPKIAEEPQLGITEDMPPVIEKAAPPGQKVAPPEEKATSPAVGGSASPAAEESASPAVGGSASPAAEESASPAAEESTSPAEEKAAALPETAASPAEEKAVLPDKATPEKTVTENLPPVADKPLSADKPLATDKPLSADKPLAKVVAPAPAAAPPLRRKRRWGRVVLGILGFLVAAGIVLVLLAPGYVRGRILDEALARGVILTFGELDLGLSIIRLHDVKVRLAGVPDFEATASFIDVEIEDEQPHAINAFGLAIAMEGTDVLGALGEWKVDHAAALAAPLSGRGARVDWRPAKGTDAALSAENADVAVDAKKGSIDAASARFNGRDAGPIKFSWMSPADGFVVRIEPRKAPLSAVHAEIWATKDGPRIKLVLDRSPLGPLQEALGIPKGSEGLEASGELEMPVPSLAHPTATDGTVKLSVKGFVPPHPRELDGILFGDTTVVKGKFQLAPDLAHAKLSPVTVEAGALSLSGSGDVAREGLDARVTLKLKGSVACTAVATSAAMAHLGAAWGRLAGSLAGGALQGSVTVSLSIEAKASDLKSAKIDKSAHIGCKVVVGGLPIIDF